jgi:hypothetical protein
MAKAAAAGAPAARREIFAHQFAKRNGKEVTYEAPRRCGMTDAAAVVEPCGARLRDFRRVSWLTKPPAK